MLVAEISKFRKIVGSVTKGLTCHPQGKGLVKLAVSVVGVVIGVKKTRSRKMLLPPLQHFYKESVGVFYREALKGSFH